MFVVFKVSQTAILQNYGTGSATKKLPVFIITIYVQCDATKICNTHKNLSFGLESCIYLKQVVKRHIKHTSK